MSFLQNYIRNYVFVINNIIKNNISLKLVRNLVLEELNKMLGVANVSSKNGLNTGNNIK